MELKRAKEVLEGMDLDVFSNKQLIREFDYLNVEAGETTSDSDGTLTADEHEAIATWMRDPEGVVNSDKNPNAWDDLDTYGPSA